MSIDSNTIYTSFAFFSPNGWTQWDVAGTLVRWTIAGPLSGDLVAGLLLGLVIATEAGVRMFWEDEQFNSDFEVEVAMRVGATISINFTTIDASLVNYVIDLKEGEGEVPRAGEFGWFIYHPLDDYSRLYSFRGPDFIRGFISMCRAYQIDFHDYMTGFPFKVGAQELTYYEIREY